MVLPSEEVLEKFQADLDFASADSEVQNPVLQYSSVASAAGAEESGTTRFSRAACVKIST